MKKIAEWISVKKLAIAVGIAFFASMLPNWLLAFIARPSGDDYGYSAASHQTWLHTHSVIEVIRTGLETTKQMCQVWNGDWFSVFIFTLMPEVFAYRSFWIVPVFWTLAMIAATYYMMHEIFTNYFGMKWYEGGMVTLLILLMFYQWIPSSAIGMYWYVGVIHYMMPHVVAMLLIGFLMKYLRTEKFRYIIFSVLGMIAIGGSSYYSAFLVLFSYILMFVIVKNKKRAGVFALPVLAGIVALYFQVTAPGNAARVGGEQMGFSTGKAVLTIVEALGQGAVNIINYIRQIPLLFVLLIFVAVIVWECLSEAKLNFRFKYPVLWVGYMFGVYAAMYAPELYAATEVSGGPGTMEYLTFILTAVSSIFYVEGWIWQRLKACRTEKSRADYHRCITVPAVLICMVLCLAFRGNLKESLFYTSCEYIVSGQAADFKEQMESQEKILLDDSIKEAYLCPTNPEQGPLMHMPVIKNPEAFTNTVVGKFYGKDLVTTTE